MITPYGVLGVKKYHDQVHRLGTDTTAKETRALTMVKDEILAVSRYFIPTILRPLLACSPMDRDLHHWWWRAISATFQLRPNPTTLALLEEFASKSIAQVDGYCISTYVRHGDKHREMALVPFERYKRAAEVIWSNQFIEIARTTDSSISSSSLNQTLHTNQSNASSVSSSVSNNNIGSNHSPLKKVLYIGSEDIGVYDDAANWGRRQGIDVVWMNISKEITTQTTKKKHPWEFLSYLVNLAEASKCQVFICTYMSNYCRLVDELRATVGGKANRYMVDVNFELCPDREVKNCIKKDALIEGRIKSEILKKWPGIW